MGFLQDLGAPENFSLGNFQGIGTLILVIIIGFFILVLAGGLAFFYYWRKSKKIQYKNQIPIFMNINGKHSRIAVDTAKEIFVPDSNISLFYLKNHKIYLARPTRAMGKNEYWYSISENGEWVNFDISMDPDKSSLALTNYDHRDTRYAYVNLKEIIKRNYKDKSLAWWKDPVIMNMIAFIIMAFIFVGACWILLGRIGHFITDLGGIADKFQTIADSLSSAVRNAQNINSGVIQAS